MTKIGEEYTLGSVNVQSFFRLPFSRGKDNCFLVNDGRNSVVKVQERKLLHSWTLTHPNSFTCPVVLDENEVIYGVMNCNTLLKWSLKDDTLKNAKKFKFPEPVFAVLPICGKQPIVLFVSGKFLQVDTLSSSVQPQGLRMVNKDEQMVWADALLFHSKIAVVCISVSKKDGRHKLSCFVIYNNDVTDYNHLPLLYESDVLKSWCFNKSKLSLYTMWSSGIILSQKLGTDWPTTLLTIPDIQDLHLLTIDSIDSNHIALGKCNPTQKEISLEIWDVQFKALKARKAMKSGSPSFIQLLATDSMIFLTYNEELIGLSVQVEKSTLAAAVGRCEVPASAKIEMLFWKKEKVVSVTHLNPCKDMEISEEDLNTLSPTELIAQKLMKRGANYLNYIPESELVNLLRLAIRFKLKRKTKHAYIEPDVILTTIFSSSFSDVFLMKFMEILSFEEAMIILEILLSLLNNNSPSSTTSSVKASDLQLFNWICLVIQSHMEALLLSKNIKCMKLLKELDDCLSEKKTEYEDYSSIQEVFCAVQEKKNILPERCVDSRYCIETLDT